MVAKNASGLNDPVNESQGGTNATTFDEARSNMGLNPSVNAQTVGYTAIVADRGRLIHYTGAGGVTLALDSAATLGDGWNVVVRNDAASAITVDPTGGELIDGSATLSLSVSQAVTIYCSGTGFYTLGQATVDDFGANTALSNLTPTAINEDLLPDTDAFYDLGDPTHTWGNVYPQNITTGHLAADAMTVSAYDVDGMADVPFITLTANNVPTCALSGDVTSVTQTAADGSTKIATTAYADRMLPLAGGTMTGTLTLNADPVSALQAATKQYVDAIAAGISIKEPCLAGSTVALTVVYNNGAAGVGATITNADTQAAWVIDGVTLAVNDRVLIKDQADETQNGIYVVTDIGSGATDWVGTRSADYDTPAEITVGSLVIIQSGTVNAVTSWIQTDTVSAVGTDPISFTQFSAGIGANTALSNLVAVAINTSLLPGADGMIDLGSAADRFRNALVEAVQTGTSAAQTTLLQAYDTNGAAYTTFATLTANNPPTMALASAVTGVTQAASDNTTKLATTAYVDNQVSSIGANRALSNLASVAINTALLPAADGTIDLGSAADRFRNALIEVVQTGTTAAQTLLLQAYNTNTLAYTTFATLTANNPPTMALESAVTATTQAASDNSTKIATTAYVDNQVSSIGANKALSNLALVAINTSLLPGVDNTIDCGDGTHRFRQMYSAGLTTGTVAGNTLILSARDVDGASDTAFITLTANNTPTCALASAVTGVTQAASDNSTKLATTAYADTQVSTIAANKALSNLAAVAINTSLLPGADNAIDCGDGTHRFRQMYSSGVTTGTVAGNTLILSARDVDGASDTAFITFTANNTPTCALASAVTGVTQAASDNSTKLATTAYTDNQVNTISANKALSNLASVAINTALLPGSDNAIDMGDGTHRFRQMYSAGLTTGSSAGNTLILSARDVDGASDTAFITLTANNTPTCVIASAVTATTQAAHDNSTKIATTAYVENAVTVGEGISAATAFGLCLLFGR